MFDLFTRGHQAPNIYIMNDTHDFSWLDKLPVQLYILHYSVIYYIFYAIVYDIV